MVSLVMFWAASSCLGIKAVAFNNLQTGSYLDVGWILGESICGGFMVRASAAFEGRVTPIFQR